MEPNPFDLIVGNSETLKNYCSKAMSSLTEEIATLRARLQEIPDFIANISKIDKFTQQEFNKYEQKNRK